MPTSRTWNIHPRYRANELRRDLDADFAQPLSVGKLARRRGVSVRCPLRDFQELTGVTIQGKSPSGGWMLPSAC